MAIDSDRPSPLRATSMFERRMLVVGAVLLVALGAMATRLFSLTVVSGAENRAVAESRLDRSTLLPTVRGRILDRKDRVLAESVPSYDLAVFYPVVNGRWTVDRAVAAARKEATRAGWARLGPEERDARIRAKEAELERELASVLAEAAGLAGIGREQLVERMSDIRQKVEKKANAVWEARLERQTAVFGDDDGARPRPIAEQAEPHVVATGLPSRAAFALRKLADAHPGIIEVRDGSRRVYPWSSARIDLDRRWLPTPLRGGPLELQLAGVADHVVGAVREEVWEEDLERRPFRSLGIAGDVTTDLGGYRPGLDMVGSRGLERTYEDLLRGSRGRVLERLETGETVRTEPVPGGDLRLTLDIALQARVQALFMPEVGLARAQQWHYGWEASGAPKPMPLDYLAELNGAAVVVEVDSGDVLAMVSWPTMAAGEAMAAAVPARGGSAGDPRLSVVNRAVEAPYPPGSIVKPLVYVSAVREGACSADEAIECTGHFFGPEDQFGRCWIYRKQNQFATHSKRLGGPLPIEQAISRSCNIYFYTLGERLGIARLVESYRGFGLGRRLDVGLARREPVRDGAGVAVGERLLGEHPGILPDASKLPGIARDRLQTVIAAIGQGPVAWTPLQAANAYATLARGGLIRDADLLRSEVPGRAPRRTGSLRLDPRSCDRALEGLRQAVEERHGTGHHVTLADRREEPIINAPGVTVWAKTGTAQAPAIRVDDDGDGTADRSVTGLEHGWFVGLVGDAAEDRPRYAVAVILEHGGSGGRSAGPIANQVIHALVSEDYLRGDPAGRTRRASPRPAGPDADAEADEPIGGAG
jgi:penicillin-binding protein 2